MPKITLHLTSEQYQALVDMVYLGDLMINSVREEPLKKYDEVLQLVYSHAKDAGLGAYIALDPDLKQYAPSSAFEEGRVSEFKTNYDDDTLWRELTERLAERDLEKRFGMSNLKELTEDERWKAWGEVCRPYEDEFSEHGLERVEIVRPLLTRDEATGAG